MEEPKEKTDKQLVSRVVAHLSRHSFAAFIKELFFDKNWYESFYPLPEVGEDVFCQPFLDSYGGSIHEVSLLHFPPLELFRPSGSLTLDDPALIKRLIALNKMYHKKIGHWGIISERLKRDDALKSIKFVTNLFGIDRNIYESTLIPAYERIQHSCGLKKARTFVGSCDSFVDLNLERTQQALRKILAEYSEGVAISISDEDVTVRNFVGKRTLASGVSAGTRSAYEPVMIQSVLRNQAILEEFSQLIRADAAEARLEEFLVAHYRDIFGTEYNRIETQLWLRFPSLDINRKNRRLDIFLRNSIKNDWDLFEIKRPVALTATYRDAPVLATEVTHAIQQVRNYGQILLQDKVKRHFVKEGIEYFKPSLNLVIGRTPQIPHAQWRWLQTDNERDVRIFTFDELLAELLKRFEDHHAILQDLLPTGDPD